MFPPTYFEGINCLLIYPEIVNVGKSSVHIKYYKDIVDEHENNMYHIS